MRAVVVNCSAAHYNLGAAKLADWLRADGHDVQSFNGDPGLFVFGADLVALSVIFSWHAPLARKIALRAKHNANVWCGGPAMAVLHNWWKRETGLECCRGLDDRFDRQRGDYRMVFASRGCPVNCWFCLVPRVEGRSFSFNYSFRPAPILCDNNLSALPEFFQRLIVYRYRKAGVPLLDANSGFEPRTFTRDTYRLWKPLLRGPWRFAFDEQKESADVERMMDILHGERSRLKQVWVLIGNEPVTSCLDRLQKVIAWGGEPWVQPVIALNALEKRPMIRHDWTEQLLADVSRYYNRRIWRQVPIQEYEPTRGGRPLAGIA